METPQKASHRRPSRQHGANDKTSEKSSRKPSVADTSAEVPQHGRRAGRRQSSQNPEDPTGGRGHVRASSPQGGADDSETPHLRADDSAGWFSPNPQAGDRVQDAVPQHLATMAEDDATATATADALARKQSEERARLAAAVAEAPTGYQAQMPRLTDLDIKNNWDRLLQSVQSEFDMSCLASCLARQLDEDIAWNPDMLLVQLTSDMHDAAELRGDDATLVPVDDSEIGLMKGGELTRKRKEKGSGVTPSNPGSPKKADGGPGSPKVLAKRRSSVKTPSAAADGSKKAETAAPPPSQPPSATSPAKSAAASPPPPRVPSAHESKSPSTTAASSAGKRKSGDASAHKSMNPSRRRSKGATNEGGEL